MAPKNILKKTLYLSIRVFNAFIKVCYALIVFVSGWQVHHTFFVNHYLCSISDSTFVGAEELIQELQESRTKN